MNMSTSWKSQLIAFIDKDLTPEMQSDPAALERSRSKLKYALESHLNASGATREQMERSMTIVDLEIDRRKTVLLNVEPDGVTMSKPARLQGKRTAAMAACFAGGLALGIGALTAAILSSPANANNESGVLDLLGYSTSPLLERQVAFLRQARTTLSAYAKANKVYPVTGEKFVAANKTFDFMKAKGMEIPQAADTVLEELRYRSNGTSYKLIYIGSGMCGAAKVTGTIPIDPVRSFKGRDCFAYGVWSAGGAKW